MKKLAALSALSSFLTALALGAQPAPEPSCLPSPSNLVHWWPLDEAEGTTARDIVSGSTGAHFHGPTPVPGKVDRALSFDGSDDYVAFPTADMGRTQTLEMWIKTTDANQAIMDGGPSYMTWRIGIDSQGRAVYHHFQNGPPNRYTSITSLTVVADGEFHNIAKTTEFPGRTIRLYIDGNLEASYTATDPEFNGWAEGAAGDVKLGKSDTKWLPGPLFFRGVVDELGHFSRVLSAEEIKAIYNAGRAGRCK